MSLRIFIDGFSLINYSYNRMHIYCIAKVEGNNKQICNNCMLKKNKSNKSLQQKVQSLRYYDTCYAERSNY